MDTCDYCGGETEHAFQCNHCNQALCGDHRLPENHECPLYSAGGETSSFGGEGPDTLDRRGTGRKRRERVRKKETSRRNPPEPVEPQSKSDNRSGGTANTDVLNCPSCGSDTDQVIECDDCGQSVCPGCEGVYEHECPVGVTKSGDTDDGSSEVTTSILGRILGMLK
jgi:predicted nucleic acid binding AN1-type Zn finger protein